MKNKIPYIAFLAILVLALFAGCGREEWATFNPKDAYVACTAIDYATRENSTSILKIPVGASNVPGQALTVNFEITADDESGYRQAVEGVDYTILTASKSVTFPTGVGYDTIRIQTINNGIKDAHSTFRIKLTTANQPYSIGFNGERTYTDVLIYDDESMSKFEGEWTVSGYTAYYQKADGLAATFDTAATNTLSFGSYDVTIVSHPTDINTFIVKGFMGTKELLATMTIDEVNGVVGLLPTKMGVVNNRDIFLAAFDDQGNDRGTHPADGIIIDDRTMSVWRYLAYYYNTAGVETAVGPMYSILKSTWTKTSE